MEEKKFTLWEHLLGKDKVPEVKLEDTLKNILKLHFEDYLLMKGVEGKSTLEVHDIIDYDRHISHEHFYHTDYYVVNEKKETLIIRAILDDGHVKILLLKHDYESAFDENILNAAKCKFFKIDEDDGTHIEYESLHEGDGYPTKVHRITNNKIEEREVKYWSYSRLKGYEISSPTISDTEFYFVEIDEETGWITMLKGYEISLHDIEIIPK